MAAVLRGHRVYAQDVNPWAAVGLATMLGLPDADSIAAAGRRLHELAKAMLKAAYATTFSDGSPATIAHTFRVATAECSSCKTRAKLFPHSMVSLLNRKEHHKSAAYLACPAGHLFIGRADGKSRCETCSLPTEPERTYTIGRTVMCENCGHSESLAERATHGNWHWEVVLVERASEERREIAIPMLEEIAQAESPRWAPTRDLGSIPDGEESKVLTRHGYARWTDLYPRRQRAILETLLRLSDGATHDEAVRRTLCMAIYGAAEMAGLLSRWDRWYLKSYESMAGHRFNFTTLTAEPNVWGAGSRGRGTVSRRLRMFAKAAQWLADRTSRQLAVEGPLPAHSKRTRLPASVDARVVEGSSERTMLPLSPTATNR